MRRKDEYEYRFAEYEYDLGGNVHQNGDQGVREIGDDLLLAAKVSASTLR